MRLEYETKKLICRREAARLCLYEVNFNSTIPQRIISLLLLVTSASDLPLRCVQINYVLFSSAQWRNQEFAKRGA